MTPTEQPRHRLIGAVTLALIATVSLSVSGPPEPLFAWSLVVTVSVAGPEKLAFGR